MIIGLAYAYTATNMIFVQNISKYWFTISLLQMFLSYYIISYCTRNYTRKKNLKLLFITLIITAICMYIALSPIRRNETLNFVCSRLFIDNTCNILCILYLASLYQRIKNVFFDFLKNQYSTAICIVTFIVLTYIQFTTLEYNSFILERVSTRIIPVLLSFSGIIIVFNFFRTYQDSFTKETMLGKGLQYIGKRTLDIYLLHYFLLPTLPIVGTFINESPNMVIELICGLTLAIIVTALCLITSNILRTNKFLEHYLFGAKRY